ncbi:hypothetical protein QBC45DRAFT_426864 [Copromyces sp. CBS 386.78]|nr:hypothetical protein QBC45DRAFT_426864 [Copromyces sp. CBS 386.78]
MFFFPSFFFFFFPSLYLASGLWLVAFGICIVELPLMVDCAMLILLGLVVTGVVVIL